MMDRSQSYGKTNWKRFGLLFGLSGAAAAAMVFSMSQGALAASFIVSGQQFKVSADRMEGNGFVNYGWVDAHAGNKAEPVAVAAIKDVTMVNMCQSVLTTLPIVGDITLKLTAGTGDTPVKATDLFIDMEQMEGNADFTNIEIGRDASTLDKGPVKGKGLQGLFGQQADKIVVNDLKQVAWTANAGRFTLSGLNMKVSKGKSECF